VAIYICSTNQCQIKMRLLLSKIGMEKEHVKVNFFVASTRKLKTYVSHQVLRPKVNTFIYACQDQVSHIK
jgi:hypothetical protein